MTSPFPRIQIKWFGEETSTAIWMSIFCQLIFVLRNTKFLCIAFTTSCLDIKCTSQWCVSSIPYSRQLPKVLQSFSPSPLRQLWSLWQLQRSFLLRLYLFADSVAFRKVSRKYPKPRSRNKLLLYYTVIFSWKDISDNSPWQKLNFRQASSFCSIHHWF